MQVTVELSDEGIHATLKALGDVFATGDSYGERQGPGYKAVHVKVDEWVKAQDFAPIIAEVAPGVVREVVHDFTGRGHPQGCNGSVQAPER